MLAFLEHNQPLNSIHRWKEDLEYKAPAYADLGQLFGMFNFEQHFFTNVLYHGLGSSAFDLTLCWYSAQGDGDRIDLRELWPSGPLYGSEDPYMRLAGRGFHVSLSCCNSWELC